ncbi:sugar ABC transporter permease [Egibacter rhizosphaerae]|uniref:Sugar ABC transporter permease n=1 Tax=Egibacter rhizosphaerae TaxID=1670831 RepID=A0A411YDD5_9ACTN|nr:sugar ABC transporter permease [Egibacter rhizosphaerae]QBI19215.1 sugar ABC transporter permease [Egibacter rhizosphaerae]
MSQLGTRPTGEAASPSEPVASAPPARRRRGPNRRFFEARILPALFLLPAALFIFGLTVWPVLRALQLSFTNADLSMFMTGEFDYIGLANYVEVATDAHLRGVFVTTAVFGLLCVLGTMVLGIAVALLLNRAFKGRTLLAILVLLPWAVPRVAVAALWEWIFHDQYGLANWMLTSVGMEFFEGFAWFNNRYVAFTAIGIAIVWQSFPFVALAMLAGLQSVPNEVMDAARVDGAGAWQRVRRIILPMLKPLLLVLIVISTIWNFKIFDQVFVMTEGGPARQTELLAITTWREAFTQHDFGLASALAMGMFVILAGVTLLYLWLIREEGEL